MYISPPISVLAMMALIVAGTARAAAARGRAGIRDATSGHLPEAHTVGQEHAGENRRPLTVVEVIEELASG